MASDQSLSSAQQTQPALANTQQVIHSHSFTASNPDHSAQQAHPDSEPDSDTDAILAELESSLDISSSDPSSTSPTENTSHLSSSPTTTSLLAARKAELQSQSQAKSPTLLFPGHISHPARLRSTQGLDQTTYLQSASSEESLIRATADAAAAVVVFYSSSFASSLLMREHVSTLAREYAMHHGHDHDHDHDRRRQRRRDENADEDIAQTQFFAAEAEKCEWLCRRLGVRVLPVVVGYVEGKEVGRVVGFEGVKGGEKASWRAVGWVVGRWNAKGIAGGTLSCKGGMDGILGQGWEDWIGGWRGTDAGKRGANRDEESDSEHEQRERETRRAAGFVGGGGAGGKLKFGASLKGTRRTEDEDDDWD